MLYLEVCIVWILSLVSPPHTSASGNHKYELFFYEFAFALDSIYKWNNTAFLCFCPQFIFNLK